MVNHGRSQGCITCRQRRVKCDEAKPECRACRRLNLSCGGYKRPINLKFKDQTHKFGNSVAIYEARVDRTKTIPRPRQLKNPDTSVDFYLGHFVNTGRRMESTRGFFDVLIPVYSVQKQNSALSLAVSALASQFLNLWRSGPASLLPSFECYSQAVVSLRRAIRDPVEQASPATALAILTLQWYENVAAICGNRVATRTHHAGALSLLTSMKSDNGPKDQATVASIRRFIIHAEVSSAMRQKRPVHSTISSWISSGGLLTLPQNPSALLDSIGVRVADLQARYGQHPLTLSKSQGDFAAEAEEISQELLIWSRNLPEHWRPRKLISGQDFDSSIPAYRYTCEAYPSSQIANIWNLWRVHRIVLFKILFESLHLEPLDNDLDTYKQSFQELVDAICYSVPFYLGNRVRPMCITDFDDTSILLCGHSLSLQDGPAHSPQSPTISISDDEHRRCVIGQGPWHIINPISRLLTLFTEDDNHYLTGILRSGQLKWIRRQFLRMTTLLHFSPPTQNSTVEITNIESSGAKALNIRANDLASRVRRGATFMSGP